ncbi:TPA: hypothetical protein DEA21_05480 [Candidatus Uhrbacteria bacterium]|nr:hypothetical protein [Candidatus Uhrbacteria bacterium]
MLVESSASSRLKNPEFAPSDFLWYFLFMNKEIKTPDEANFVYADNIDYSSTADESVWGSEEPETHELLAAEVNGGQWLDVCAGDGRFSRLLLEKSDHLTVCDIDPGALEKLKRVTPPELKEKLSIVVCNVVKPLPFNNASFEGLFSSGTFHLFPAEVFQYLAAELERIVKPGGKIIFDFAINIRREKPDGTLYVVSNEPLWNETQARELLASSFPGSELSLKTFVVEPEIVRFNDTEYVFKAEAILVQAVKK